MLNRPEDPNLDDVQRRDLLEFLSSRSKEELERDLKQTEEDNAGGGAPANVNWVYSMIKLLLGK